MHLTLPPPHPTTLLPQTPRTLTISALFGLPLNPPAPPPRSTSLTLTPGTITLITGPSGSGKSTLLHQIRIALLQLPDPPTILSLSDIPLPATTPIVDCFESPLEETLRHLSIAGLSEARLLLRPPAQLSEGEQFRYRLAQFLASNASLLLADEFAASLDRLTAKIISWHLQKHIHNSRLTPHPRTAILATSHTDLTQDLHPTQTLHLK